MKDNIIDIDIINAIEILYVLYVFCERAKRYWIVTCDHHNTKSKINDENTATKYYSFDVRHESRRIFQFNKNIHRRVLNSITMK